MTGARGSLLPFALAAAVLVAGWWSLWFLCDDAFIAFRYVGNAHDGLGFVWNPPPFLPVEGYTSFLWVLVLHVVWLLTGIAPPQSSNPLALLCALSTLLLVARRLAVMAWPERAACWRPWLATAVLLAIASSHTFATWASSGLETAMFGLWCVAWTLAATARRAAWSRRDLAALGTYAALAMLTRPDGALLVLATLLIAVHQRIRGALSWRVSVGGCLPLLAPAVHLGWRRWCYGEWLPNTYYAKVVAAWPASGLRYLYCFAVEHGLWLWLPLAVVWALRSARRPGTMAALLHGGFAPLVAVGTWCAYVGYYTLVAGGDHFAYRPFTLLIPLLSMSGLIMLLAVVARPGGVLGGLVVFAIAANSFGWWYDHALRGREQDGFVRASAALPAPLGNLFTSWDRHQAWLRLRYVALPRGLHAVTCRDLLTMLPERRPGQVQGLAGGQRGVYRTVAAGVVSWSLADVAIVDAVGLNDWVVARHVTPPALPPLDAGALRGLLSQLDGDGDGRLSAGEIAAAAATFRFSAQSGVLVRDAAWSELLLAICDRDGNGLDAVEFEAAIGELGNQRHMAHERTPPAGYIEALRPNVVLDGGRFRWVPGVAPLTDAEIVAVEQEYRAKVRRR